MKEIGKKERKTAKGKTTKESKRVREPELDKWEYQKLNIVLQ